MADRHFSKLPLDCCDEDPDLGEEDVSLEEGTEFSLHGLLLMPYPRLAEKLRIAAMGLKKKIVAETWYKLDGQGVGDYTLFSGVLGTAFLLFKSYAVTNNLDDLSLSSEIIKACDSATNYSGVLGSVTFICGRAGVCALGAVVANCMDDQQLLEYYLSRFREITLPKDLNDDLMNGRAGYLWACCYINRFTGGETIPLDVIGDVADEIISNGRELGRAECPLMFEWNGQRYWGAAYGLAGIMHALMDAPLKPDQLDDVKGTLLYMVKSRLSSGNYPESEEDQMSDVLVHWGHGAPGIALTLIRASEVFGDEAFLQDAIDAAQVVWERGPLKGVGLYDGISGNAYVFGSLFRVTSMKEFLFKAKSFTCFLLDRAQKLIYEGKMHVGDHPHSLFDGIGGMAYLFLDMLHPACAKFPAYDM